MKHLVALDLAEGIEKKTRQNDKKAPLQSSKSKVAQHSKDGDNEAKPEEKVKRKRGRPRTKPAKDPNAPKRPRGRPRIRPIQKGPKRPVGRPRKEGTAPKSSTT